MFFFDKVVFGRYARIARLVCITLVFFFVSIFSARQPVAGADPDSTDQPTARWYFTNPQASPCGILPSILQNSGFDVTDPALVESANFADIYQDDPHTSIYETIYLNAMHQLFSDQNDSSICSWRSRTNPARDNLQVTVFHWSSSEGPREANDLRVAELNVMKVINCQAQLNEIRRKLAAQERRNTAPGRQQSYDGFHTRQSGDQRDRNPRNRSPSNLPNAAAAQKSLERPIECTPQGPMFVNQDGSDKQYTPVIIHTPRHNPHDHQVQSHDHSPWPIEDFTRSIFDNPVHFSSGIYGCTASSDLGLFIMARGYRCDKLANMLVKVLQP